MRKPARRTTGRPSFATAILALALPLLLAGAAAAAPTFRWADLHDGGAQSTDYATAILADPQGNPVLGGESADGVDGADLLVRKLERTGGATLWSRRVTSGEINDMALSGMVWDGKGNILVGGYVRGCVG